MSVSTARTAHSPMHVLRTVFPGRIVFRFAEIKRSIPLARCGGSTELLPLGLRQQQGKRKASCNNDDLKQRIRKYIQATPKEMPQRAVTPTKASAGVN